MKVQSKLGRRILDSSAEDQFIRRRFLSRLHLVWSFRQRRRLLLASEPRAPRPCRRRTHTSFWTASSRRVDQNKFTFWPHSGSCLGCAGRRRTGAPRPALRGPGRRSLFLALDHRLLRPYVCALAQPRCSSAQHQHATRRLERFPSRLRILLAVYSAGLAVPFLLTALGIGQFLRFYQRFRKYLHAVELFSGALLLFVGGLVFVNKLTWLAGKLSFLNGAVFWLEKVLTGAK